MSVTMRLAEAARRLEAAGVESARLEAQLLLAHVLGVTRTAVVAGLAPEPDAAQWAAFAALVVERARGMPLAYLRGDQEFYGLTFAVSQAVLIPRPETELLVEFALEKLTAASDPGASARPLLADVGTGSGCIAIATLAHRPEAQAIASDLSAEALALAQTSAEANGVGDRVRFVRADLLSAVASGRFAVIVSNPPYIPTAEIPTLQREVRDFEPRLALDGGADGLTPHRVLAREALRALQPGGWLAVEVAMGQAQAVEALLRAAGWKNVESRRDLAGIERMVIGQKDHEEMGQ